MQCVANIYLLDSRLKVLYKLNVDKCADNLQLTHIQLFIYILKDNM